MFGSFEQLGTEVLVVVVVFGLVRTVILVVGWGPVSSGSSGVQGSQMGGLGVLHFGGIDWDSVVDDWDVLSSMPGSGSVPSWGGVPSGNGNWGWVSGAGGSMGGKVLGLGVLDFGGVDRTGTDQTARLLVGGEVFGLGGGDLGGVGRDVVPVGGRSGGSQQQNGSYDEEFHFC